MKKIYLVLSCGKIFEGQSFGADCEVAGELVFTTSMTGYIETLSDPNFYGQIAVASFPLLGNYGAMEEDMQSAVPVLKGLAVREHCTHPSNFRMESSLDDFMKKYGIVGICGLDTRELTALIREEGVQGAVICEAVTDAVLQKAKDVVIAGAVQAVSTKQKVTYPSVGPAIYNVTVIDYGVKRSLIDALTSRGCTVTLVPYNTSAAEILSDDPDGIVLSGGPGNPKDNPERVAVLKDLIGNKPVFGVGMGHQLLALAMGGDTFKMKYGHRGSNQPATASGTNRTYITAQNHGYAVDAASLPAAAVPLFSNTNDGTCEGLDYPDCSAFSVQFAPESYSTPKNNKLFARFIAMMGGEK